MTVPECVQIGLSLATALAHLHEQGLVHRDIKPSNIIFVNGVPKLSDIGLVTEAGDTQSIVGTEGYLPPEGPGTPQADLFSLGKVLYEISTGMDRRRFAELPDDLREWPDREAVIEFNEIVLRACAKDPAQRFQTAERLRADLALLHEGKSVRRAHRLEEYWRWLRRGAAAVFFGAAAVALIFFAVRGRQPLTAARVEKRSTNEVANRLYKLGRYYFEKNTEMDLERARNYFDQATKADPAFAQPYGGLAMIYVWAFDGWKVLPKQVALKGIELDESLAEPHILLGWIHAMREWDWPAAERELKRAIQLDPTKVACHHFYAECLRMQGKTNESIASMKRAIELEPRSIIFQRRYADHLLAARRFEEAVRQAEDAIGMEPRVDAAVYYIRSRALGALGRYEEAIENDRIPNELELKSPEKAAFLYQAKTTAYEHEGPRGYWRAGLLREPDSAFWMARRYAQIGDTNQAIAQLSFAFEERETWLTFYVMTDWTLDPIRGDPRFQEILRKMGLKK